MEDNSVWFYLLLILRIQKQNLNLYIYISSFCCHRCFFTLFFYAAEGFVMHGQKRREGEKGGFLKKKSPHAVISNDNTPLTWVMYG